MNDAPVTPDFPFTTDDCSGHVYKTLSGNDPPWKGCCVEHDRAYWMGGTAKQRKVADKALRACVRTKAEQAFLKQGDSPAVAKYKAIALAYGVYRTVRVTGHPLLPYSWRWGYGWKVKGYRAL